MATEQNLFDIGLKAAADYSAKQFYAMKMTTADTATLVSAAADRTIGILQNKPKADEAAQVRCMGISKAVSDGSGTAIAVGDYVGSNASGKMVKKATADYTAFGLAMDASSADGTVIRVLAIPLNWFRTAGG